MVSRSRKKVTCRKMAKNFNQPDIWWVTGGIVCIKIFRHFLLHLKQQVSVIYACKPVFAAQARSWPYSWTQGSQCVEVT